MVKILQKGECRVRLPFIEKLSEYSVQIGTGRHAVPKTPENLRICPYFHLNEVEHELLFLFNCNLYDILRSNFYRNISNRSPFCIILTTMNKSSSYLKMSILKSTDSQLLTYIHVWNIYRNLFFNYSLYFDL